MAVMKLFLKDESDDLKNQIEFDNTGIDEFDLFFSLREQIQLLKEENKTKSFIAKYLLQKQNNFSSIGTKISLITT